MKNLTIACLGLALLTAPLPLMAVATAQDDNPLENTAASIDIMRRVLVMAINRDLSSYLGVSDKDADENEQDARTDAVAPQPLVASRSYGGTGYSYVSSSSGSGLSSMFVFTDHSRGYYVPGHGAIFSLKVNVPRKAADADEAKAKASEDDLWNEAKREASGVSSSRSTFWVNVPGGDSGTVYVIDDEALDSTIDTVIDTVAKHGLKIEGLADSDSIIVAMNVEGGAVRTVGRKSDEAATVYTALAFAAANDEERHVIIEIPVEDLQRYAGQKIDLDGLKGRARITRY